MKKLIIAIVASAGLLVVAGCATQSKHQSLLVAEKIFARTVDQLADKCARGIILPKRCFELRDAAEDIGKAIDLAWDTDTANLSEIQRLIRQLQIEVIHNGE